MSGEPIAVETSGPEMNPALPQSKFGTFWTRWGEPSSTAHFMAQAFIAQVTLPAPILTSI